MVKKATKKTTKKTPVKAASKRIDFEPTKMTFAVATLAVVSLVILTILAMYA